ncbi:hypothetical protein ckin106_04320 [Helicobacter pylori]
MFSRKFYYKVFKKLKKVKEGFECLFDENRTLTELLFFLRNKACLDPHAILNPYVWQNSYFGRKHGKN